MFPQKGVGGKQDSTYFAKVHEYILCYAKNKDTYESKIPTIKRYPNYDEAKQMYYSTQLLRKWGDASLRTDRPNMYYPIYYNPQTKHISIDEKKDGDIEVYPFIDANTEGRWRWGKETMREGINGGCIEIVENRGKYVNFMKESMLIPKMKQQNCIQHGLMTLTTKQGKRF